jgi:hypothetical protein
MRKSWRKVTGYENIYWVSNKGEVKNRRGLIMLPQLAFGKYYCVGLSKNRFLKSHYIHRLVAVAFHPNPENKRVVNHKNNNKLDNRAENLEWNTYSENNLHGFKNGFNKYHGDRHHWQKFTVDQIKEIRDFKGVKTSNEVAKKYGTSYGYILQIWRGVARPEYLSSV